MRKNVFLLFLNVLLFQLKFKLFFLSVELCEELCCTKDSNSSSNYITQCDMEIREFSVNFYLQVHDTYITNNKFHYEHLSNSF